jgi:hypothetical protein
MALRVFVSTSPSVTWPLGAVSGRFLSSSNRANDVFTEARLALRVSASASDAAFSFAGLLFLEGRWNVSVL